MPTSIRVLILGFSFPIPTPYNAGHICSAAEASALNKLLVRGTSKGLHKVLSGKANETSVQRDRLMREGEEYITEFREGFSLGHDEVRAVKVEASRIARQLLEAQLNRQGKSLSDLAPGELEFLHNDLVNSEKVKSEALRRVRVTQEIATRAHDELLGTSE